MKKVFLFSMILCASLLIGCNEDKPDPVIPGGPQVELLDGAIVINDNPDVNIDKKDEFPEGSETSSSESGLKAAIRLTGDEESSEQLAINDYRFKLVAQMSTLNIVKGEKKYAAQASHVKILDEENGGYAFVSYNHKYEPNIGGLVVYKYTITGEQLLETVSVNVEAITSIEMPNAQINAVDFDGQKLYIAGATDKPSSLGFKGEDPAFFMVMELDNNKKFKPIDPDAIVQLTSFQSTSIRYFNNRIYITTGDGTNGTQGGLYVYSATDYSLTGSILGKEHARSVDVDESGIYLMQANHARVSKYNLDGSGATEIYNVSGEAMQRNAKSDILVWGDYLFVSQNETGLRMLFKNDGSINESLDAPNKNTGCVGVDPECWYDEEDVTNSVSMNSDPKKAFDYKGNPYWVNSDLLLLANGRQGLYWYDIVQDSNEKDRIVSGNPNSILKETGSANFVKSKGNIVFVADGLGGLKVLYIGFNIGDEPDGLVSGDGCDDFMPYLLTGTSPLFPEDMGVFRGNAHDIVKTLFQLPSRKEAADATLNYIKVTKNSSLYITYMAEGAGWNNALGYFVIPAEVAENDAAEYEYYTNNIKPNLTTTKNGVNVLKDEYIIFSYIRDVNPVYTSITKGHMVPGNTYQIGGIGKTFHEGDRVVLFMCPDGFSPQNNRVEVTFNPGNNGNVKQIFFMHKYFNKQTGIKYAAAYGDFAGVQIPTFYSASCESMVLCIEDIHTQNPSLDMDFNDIIFSVSDNLDHTPVTSFELPQWTVGERYDNPGELEIVPTDEHLK